MPKPYSFPTLLDESLQLSVSKLKELGFLPVNEQGSGIFTWSRNGNRIASITVHFNLKSVQPFIVLDYNSNGEPLRYKINLAEVPSNLGKGNVWYFVCPITNKQCRKLYLNKGYFAHREAFKGSMYESQTYSKKSRELIKEYKKYFSVDELYQELYSKHFKRTYRGKPTRRYSRIQELLQNNL